MTLCCDELICVNRCASVVSDSSLFCVSVSLCLDSSHKNKKCGDINEEPDSSASDPALRGYPENRLGGKVVRM
jgi:hypothetical protein